MKISIVVGLNFGDEGKGATVNALCKNPKDTVVVRFQGGHQCGHTAIHNGIRHVFSNFGSGTLKGVSTFWSEYCTVDPVAVVKECNELRKNGFMPEIIYDANAMVTTPYDIYENIFNDENRSHGTVGVGFGKTIQRNEDMYHLYVRDLQYPDILNIKLEQISRYAYRQRHYDTDALINMERAIKEFKKACNYLVSNYKIVNDFRDTDWWEKELIFEGGQGIMLDMDYGFFPHVTRSKTTSKNAMALIAKWDMLDRQINKYYVTRAYQTRHGSGSMINENIQDISYIKINPTETNVDTGKQGIFRRAMLDIPQLQYAVSCDVHDTGRKWRILHNNLVITCHDHVGGMFIFGTDSDGKVQSYTPEKIANELNCSNYYVSNSDQGIDPTFL